MENLEGSKWNSFALQTNEDVSSFGFSIYSRWEGDEFVSALAQTGQTMYDRTRSAWAMPIGIVGFTQFRYVIDTIASAAPSIARPQIVNKSTLLRKSPLNSVWLPAPLWKPITGAIPME